jgi:hypothetical protein
MTAPSTRRESAAGPPTPPADGSIQLTSTLVPYADRPDRRTIYPPDASNVAGLSTWLTADADAFRDLGAMR